MDNLILAVHCHLATSSLEFFNQPIGHQSTKSIKTESTSKAVEQFINIFNSLAYDWMVKDEGKVT